MHSRSSCVMALWVAFIACWVFYVCLHKADNYQVDERRNLKQEKLIKPTLTRGFLLLINLPEKERASCNLFLVIYQLEIDLLICIFLVIYIYIYIYIVLTFGVSVLQNSLYACTNSQSLTHLICSLRTVGPFIGFFRLILNLQNPVIYNVDEDFGLRGIASMRRKKKWGWFNKSSYVLVSKVIKD